MSKTLWTATATAVEAKLDAGGLSVTGTPPRQHLLLERLFEDGDLRGFRKADGYWPSVVSAPHPVRGGLYSMRSYIDRRVDPEPWRCEVQVAQPDDAPPNSGTHFRFAWGQVYWIGLSIFLPPDFVIEVPNYGDTLFQVHLKPDEGELWRSPIFNIHIEGNSWRFARRWDVRPFTPPDEGKGSWTGMRFYDVPLGDSVGRWNDFVINARWTWEDSGFVKVWKDGAKVLDVVGPIGSNDQSGPHVAVGLYKWPWRDPDVPSNTNTRLFYHDCLRIGDAQATYDDVAP